MPRDGSGVASWPANGDAISNTVIDSNKYNNRWADLLTMLNTATPISAGGTNATTAVGGADNLSTIGANIASAATTDLSTASGTIVGITGNATITGLGTVQAGAMRHLTFSGAATLTHNATSLILPGAANIVTAAGDTALAQSLGGGNWRVRAYQRANGSPVTINQPTIIGPATIAGAAAGTMLTVSSTDAGAASGPNAVLLRDSASPAINDLLAFLRWDGRDSIAAQQTYAQIYAQIIDPVSGTEDGALLVETVIAGVIAGRLAIGAGVYTPGATGGDKGVDTINAVAYYQNGARLSGVPDAILEDQKASGTQGGSLSSGSWVARDLNTKAYDPNTLITLASNQFTPSVNGRVEWDSPGFKVNLHKTRLFNVTDSTVAGVGMSASSGSGEFGTSVSSGGCAVVAGKAYRIEHQGSTTNGTNGMGVAVGFTGAIEVYSRVRFWRTA